MNTSARVVVAATALLIGTMLLWQSARGMYFEPRRDLLERLERAQSSINERERSLDGRPRQERIVREIAQKTLGPDLDSADHHLRTRLNRIGEEVGLERASVSTGSPAARRSPASWMFRPRIPIEREMRDMIDFVELDGSITGEGSLAQIIELIDRIEAEEWIKRIHEVRLNPHGPSNGERFSATIRLRTLFLPDSRVAEARGSSDAIPTIAAAAYDDARLARFAAIIDTNPFRVPPPEEPTQQAEQPAPSPPAPRFAYRQWVLTGVAESPTSAPGSEAWLLNRNSGERRVLTPGETLGDAVFVAIRGDEAIFKIGESQFLVQVGGNLDHKTPVNK